MAKLTTAQPIPIGTATGRSDHRTNTAQLQQTTTLRMCRADLDPPRADGLLRRTVGPAFRARTAHRHRIGNHDLKTHPVASGRKADTVYELSRNTFASVIRLTMSLAHRLGTAAFIAVITSIGMTPAAEAHTAHHHHRHSYKVYTPVKRQIVIAPATRSVRVPSYGHGSRVNVRVGFNL
jgi:hypothetical protein